MVSLDLEHSPFPMSQMSDIKNKGNKLHIYTVYFQKQITTKLMKPRSRAPDLTCTGPASAGRCSVF